jgi:DNA ligase-1
VTALAEVVRTSDQVAATASRLDKVEAIARLLRRLEPAELAIAIPFLSGEARQGRLAVPFASLRAAGARASAASLTLDDVDRAFAALKATKGKGAAGRREATLGQLLDRATEA